MIGFFCRVRTFTATITSLVSRLQRIRPYTPRHNGKVECYNRILAEECLYARSYFLRAAAPRPRRGVEPPLQLPPTPHCLRQPASCHARRTRRQRHDLIRLEEARTLSGTRAVRSSESPRV